jgi:hypothetical protein
MNTKELERQERIDAHYRALAKNIWLFTIASVIISLLIFFGMSSPSYSCPNITVTVKQGDTLDGIIREHCSGTYTDALDDMVSEYGTTIYAGQVVILPSDI